MRILRRLLIIVVALALIGLCLWSLLLAPAINSTASELLAGAGLTGAIVEVHPDGATLSIPTLPAAAVAAGIAAVDLKLVVAGVGVEDVGALVNELGGGRLSQLPAGIDYTLSGSSLTLPVLGGQLYLDDLTVSGDGQTATIHAYLDQRFTGAARAAVSEIDGGLQVALADGSTIRLDGASLTQDGERWVVDGSIEIATLLALAR